MPGTCHWDRRYPSVPTQHNAYDCGVFMLCNIEALRSTSTHLLGRSARR
jgi:Ulp1 family protease